MDVRQHGAAELELSAGLERDASTAAVQRNHWAVRRLALGLPAVPADELGEDPQHPAFPVVLERRAGDGVHTELFALGSDAKSIGRLFGAAEDLEQLVVALDR